MVVAPVLFSSGSGNIGVSLMSPITDEALWPLLAGRVGLRSISSIEVVRVSHAASCRLTAILLSVSAFDAYSVFRIRSALA